MSYSRKPSITNISVFTNSSQMSEVIANTEVQYSPDKIATVQGKTKDDKKKQPELKQKDLRKQLEKLTKKQANIDGLIKDLSKNFDIVNHVRYIEDNFSKMSNWSGSRLSRKNLINLVTANQDKNIGLRNEFIRVNERIKDQERTVTFIEKIYTECSKYKKFNTNFDSAFKLFCVANEDLFTGHEIDSLKLFGQYLLAVVEQKISDAVDGKKQVEDDAWQLKDSIIQLAKIGLPEKKAWVETLRDEQKQTVGGYLEFLGSLQAEVTNNIKTIKSDLLTLEAPALKSIEEKKEVKNTSEDTALILRRKH